MTGREPLAASAPLLAAYLAAASRDRAPFSVPGHKGRSGALDAGLGLAADTDVPLYGGLDAMKLTPGELITAGLLGALRQQAAEGSRIAYAADRSLRTLRVLTG